MLQLYSLLYNTVVKLALHQTLAEVTAHMQIEYV